MMTTTNEVSVAEAALAVAEAAAEAAIEKLGRCPASMEYPGGAYPTSAAMDAYRDRGKSRHAWLLAEGEAMHPVYAARERLSFARAAAWRAALGPGDSIPGYDLVICERVDNDTVLCRTRVGRTAIYDLVSGRRIGPRGARPL